MMKSESAQECGYSYPRSFDADRILCRLSLKQLIREGLGGVTGRITSAPAKHLSVLCNQMVNFLGIMQNEWAGAQAFSSFDTYLAPFVKADHLTYTGSEKMH